MDEPTMEELRQAAIELAQVEGCTCKPVATSDVRDGTLLGFYVQHSWRCPVTDRAIDPIRAAGRDYRN